jgi:hypothetical protein
MGELANFVRETICDGVPEVIIGALAVSTSPSWSGDDG